MFTEKAITLENEFTSSDLTAGHEGMHQEEHLSDNVGTRPCKGLGFSFYIFVFMMSFREAVLLSRLRSTYVV